MKTRAKEAATLKRLEALLLVPSVRRSREHLARLLADDFSEFGSSGARYDKKEMIEALRREAREPLVTAAIKDCKVTWLSKDVAQLTYRSVRANGSRTSTANRSSIWKRIGGRWQMIFHQATPVPGDRTKPSAHPKKTRAAR